MRIVFVSTCLLFISICLVGRAQEVRIHLENCSLEKETLSEIQNAFNFQLQFYTHIFGDQAITGFKARIFRNEKEFAKYSREKTNFNPVRKHSVAFYNFKLKEMILYKEIDDFPKIFAHELSHAIKHYYCESSSTWLDEGLAEFFEDIVFKDSAYYFDIAQLSKVQETKTFFLEGGSVTEPIFAKNFYNNHLSARNYTLSWALVFYLYKSNRDILSGIIRGDCSEDVDRSFFNYPGGLELLQNDVKAFFLNYSPDSH